MERDQAIWRCVITTQSGSVYVIVPRDGNTWWVSARNVANPRSEKLPADTWWPIAPVTPWPPEIGQRHLLVALETTPSGVPKRMPGGGKITSPSVLFCWIGWRPGAEPTFDEPTDGAE